MVKREEKCCAGPHIKVDLFSIACTVSEWNSASGREMGKGFFISKGVGVVCIILGAGAVATIIALSVVYSQEKATNDNQVSPTNGATTPTTSKPPTTTTTPSNNPWDKYRLPKSLVPEIYNITLWPRLTPDPKTGLYIFTGNVFIYQNFTRLLLCNRLHF